MRNVNFSIHVGTESEIWATDKESIMEKANIIFSSATSSSSASFFLFPLPTNQHSWPHYPPLINPPSHFIADDCSPPNLTCPFLRITASTLLHFSSHTHHGGIVSTCVGCSWPYSPILLVSCAHSIVYLPSFSPSCQPASSHYQS